MLKKLKFLALINLIKMYFVNRIILDKSLIINMDFKDFFKNLSKYFKQVGRIPINNLFILNTN